MRVRRTSFWPQSLLHLPLPLLVSRTSAQWLNHQPPVSSAQWSLLARSLSWSGVLNCIPLQFLCARLGLARLSVASPLNPDRLSRYLSRFTRTTSLRVDPPRITALTLPARCCSATPPYRTTRSVDTCPTRVPARTTNIQPTATLRCLVPAITRDTTVRPSQSNSSSRENDSAQVLQNCTEKSVLPCLRPLNLPAAGPRLLSTLTSSLQM